MEKVILEEINSMKYLLGYKRGIVISEQEEKTDLIDKYGKTSTPVTTTDDTTAAVTTTDTSGVSDKELDSLNYGDETKVDSNIKVGEVNSETPVTSTGPIKMGVKNPRIQYLQELLNYKFKSGLQEDGKYGPKTAAAIFKNIEAIKQIQLNSTQQTGETIKTDTNITQQ
jgi:peptidoglycan hydrolase-like protein with peptidoglycan-binding domain